jgi:hypothetical protein
MAWCGVASAVCQFVRRSRLFCFTWTESKEEDELDWMDVLVLGVGRREGMCYLFASGA